MVPNEAGEKEQIISKDSKHSPPEIKIYYFALLYKEKYKDPSDQFRQRFASNKLPIKKVSESYADPNSKDYGWSYIKDKRTKEVGARFYVTQINWLSKYQVNAHAGYEAGGLNAGSALYWMKFIKRYWKIVKIIDSIVS